jgi:hypothetical protein
MYENQHFENQLNKVLKKLIPTLVCEKKFNFFYKELDPMVLRKKVKTTQH